MKTHYFSNFRRGAQTALSLVLGGMFLILGTVELLSLNKIWGAVFVAVGALVVLVPQFTIHAGYTYGEGVIRVNKGFFSVSEMKAAEIPVLLITVYDAYKQWKGFKPVYTTVNGERKIVPALLLLGGVNERDLELCDTRCNAKICCKETLKGEMFLNFRFLEQILNAGFAGKIYINEPVYLSYQAQFDALLSEENKDNTVVFRRTGGNAEQK